MPKRAKGEPPIRVGRGIVFRKRTGEERRQLSIFVSPETYKAIGHWAVDAGMPVSIAAVELIERALERETAGEVAVGQLRSPAAAKR